MCLHKANKMSWKPDIISDFMLLGPKIWQCFREKYAAERPLREL